VGAGRRLRPHIAFRVSDFGPAYRNPSPTFRIECVGRSSLHIVACRPHLRADLQRRRKAGQMRGSHPAAGGKFVHRVFGRARPFSHALEIHEAFRTAGWSKAGALQLTSFSWMSRWVRWTSRLFCRRDAFREVPDAPVNNSRLGRTCPWDPWATRRSIAAGPILRLYREAATAIKRSAGS